MKCAGEKFWLWRAVDQHGFVLEEILQRRRDKRAAKRLLVALMKRYGFVPKRIITDKLRAYGPAKADVAPSLHHWSHKGLKIAPRTAICRFENENEPCRVTDRRERCNGSSPCTQFGRFFEFRAIHCTRKRELALGTAYKETQSWKTDGPVF